MDEAQMHLEELRAGYNIGGWEGVLKYISDEYLDAADDRCLKYAILEFCEEMGIITR